jgi:hypothetical protein
MKQLKVMIELDEERTSEFATALRDKHIKVEGPDQIDSLDGIALAAFIVTITPVVMPFIIQLVQALKGTKGRIVRGKEILDLENFSAEQLASILRTNIEPK